MKRKPKPAPIPDPIAMVLIESYCGSFHRTPVRLVLPSGHVWTLTDRSLFHLKPGVYQLIVSPPEEPKP